MKDQRWQAPPARHTSDRGLLGPESVAWRVIGHPVALVKELARRPACLTSGPNLYDGTFYPMPKSGKASVLKQLGPLEGFPPATQDRPQGPK